MTVKRAHDRVPAELDTPSAEPASEGADVSVYRIGGLGLLAIEIAALESVRRAFCLLSVRPEKRALASDYSGMCAGWRHSIEALGVPVRAFVRDMCGARTRPIFFLDPGCPFVSQDELDIMTLLRSLRHHSPEHWQRAAGQLAEDKDRLAALIDSARQVCRCAASLRNGEISSSFCTGGAHERTLH